MKKRIPFILLALGSLLGGCHQDQPAQNNEFGEQLLIKPPPPDEKRSPCPEGTEMKGYPPPQGLEEWCQRPSGILQGRQTIWHRNGQKAAEGQYSENQKQGEWNYWHPNGNPASKGEYREGKKNGAWIFWYENGNKAEEGEYLDGKERGIWSQWDESGEKKADIKYPS